MKALCRRIKRKLISRLGESIAEVLIAMLIIELALLMAVSMIASAGKMITKSEKAFEMYYAERNAFEIGHSTDDTIVFTKPDVPSTTIIAEEVGKEKKSLSVISSTVKKNGGSVDLECYEYTLPAPSGTSG